MRAAWERLADLLIGSKRVLIPVALTLTLLVAGWMLLPAQLSNPSTHLNLVSNCILSIASGSVQVQYPGSSVWEECNDGSILEAGTQVRTAPQSEALLTFFEGTTVELGPATEIQIERLEQDSGVKVILLKQSLGKTWSRVADMTTPGSHYEIETPSAYALVRGTYFLTEVNEAGDTRVQVAEGLVKVSAQGKDVFVPVGYEVMVEDGDSPTELSLMDIAVDNGDNKTVPSTNTETYPTSPSPSPDPTPEPTATPIPTPTYTPTPTPSSTPRDGDSNSPAPITHTLILSSTTGGSVAQPIEGTFQYPPGTVVNLMAAADSGYTFCNWTGDVAAVANVNAASTTITMNGDYSITANFIPLPTHTLTLSSNANGVVDQPGEGVFSYDEGDVANLVAIANPGYQFEKWAGDVSTVADVNAASTTITMNDDYSINAVFTPVKSLTVSSTVGGSVTQPGEGTFTYWQGTEVNLVAVAEPGYTFIGWTGSTGTITDTNSAVTSITMEGNYTIVANFS